MNATARVILGFVLACGLGGAPEAQAVTFTRYPWLSIQTPTSILITWQTDLGSSSRVIYGPEPIDWNSAAQATEPGMVVDHAVPLAGLTPGTAYHYAVVSDLDTLDAGTFRTAPASPGPFRFLAFGDLGTATPDQFRIAARIDTLNADLAILTGDIIYESGEPQNFTPYYFNVYRPTLTRIPFYPSLGNHDTYYDGGASYINTFYLPTNDPSDPERSYSFDYGNAHFVAIEVTMEDTSPDPVMTAWLDADLAATTQPWKFVYFHVPMYSNGGSHGADATIAAGLEPIFDARGVDIVFQGHNHYYTRTYPLAHGAVVSQVQDPNYMNPGGPIYIVTGGAGRALQPIVPLSPYEAVTQGIFHVTAVDLNGDSLTLRAIDEDGIVFDMMTIRKGTPTAIEVAAFRAEPDPEGVRLKWMVSGVRTGALSFHVYRSLGGEAPTRLTTAPLSGGLELEYLDRTAVPGTTYRYRLGILENGTERLTDAIEGTAGTRYRFAIRRPQPNPSTGVSEIGFTLARRSRAAIQIVDAAGRRVQSIELGYLDPGPHQARWDGRDSRGHAVSSGRYFAALRAGAETARVPLTLVR